jgi:hypothetical protein
VVRPGLCVCVLSLYGGDTCGLWLDWSRAVHLCDGRGTDPFGLVVLGVAGRERSWVVRPTRAKGHGWVRITYYASTYTEYTYVRDLPYTTRTQPFLPKLILCPYSYYQSTYLPPPTLVAHYTRERPVYLEGT